MALSGIPGLFPSPASPWAPSAPSAARDAGDGRGTSGQLLEGVVGAELLPLELAADAS